MAVVDHDRYGSAEQALTLTAPLTVETGWPRFAAAGDQFAVPVKVLNNTAEDVDVSITLDVVGALEVQPTTHNRRMTVTPGEPVICCPASCPVT